MASRRSEDDETLENNKCPYSPPPNRNHTARQAQQLHCHILTVAVLQVFIEFSFNLIRSSFKNNRKTVRMTVLGFKYTTNRLSRRLHKAELRTHCSVKRFTFRAEIFKTSLWLKHHRANLITVVFNACGTKITVMKRFLWKDGLLPCVQWCQKKSVKLVSIWFNLKCA